MKSLLRLTLIAVVLLSSTATAQDEKKSEDPEEGWINNMVVGLNLSQVYLENWTAGGENTLAWTALLNGSFVYLSDDVSWRQIVKLAYGKTKLGDAAESKTDDELFYDNVIGVNTWEKWKPYGAFQLRSQFAPGYKTVTDPETGEDMREQSSDFFDPAYGQLSLGIAFVPAKMFSTRLGIASRQTLSSVTYLWADDPDTENIEVTRAEFGIESSSTLNWQIDENIRLASQLDMFSSFETLDVWVVRWDNTFIAKINAYLNTSLNIQVVHDISQTRRTQLKEALALGIQYVVL